VEVKVIDGENLKPPLFSQFAYDVSVSEGASIGSEVMTLEVNKTIDIFKMQRHQIIVKCTNFRQRTRKERM